VPGIEGYAEPGDLTREAVRNPERGWFLEDRPRRIGPIPGSEPASVPVRTGCNDQTETGDNPDPATDAMVAELRGTVEDLRTERDRLLTVIERLSLPVPQRGATVPSGPIPMPAPPDAQPRQPTMSSPPVMAIARAGMAPVHSAPPADMRGWFQRLLGKTG
jgi:hypothetical protein